MMNRLALYAKLVRIDKPIGILLLLWPTLIALWMAAQGVPAWHFIAIYVIGTTLMRSAGCAINDFADRDIDKHVKRTVDRPLTSGKIQSWEAIMITVVLMVISLLLILPLNNLTKLLAIPAAIIAATYPYFKRFFAIPQAYLGIAFGFGIPMAFASVTNTVPVYAWLLLVANIFWTVAYDTEYAMVDRDDDLKLGIKTSAITFGRYDVAIVMLCYVIALGLIWGIGCYLQLNYWFHLSMYISVGIAIYHYFLIRHRERGPCFKAFLHNNWIGAAIFVGVVLSYATKSV